MTTVGIFSTGFARIRPERLCALLNARSSPYQFSVGPDLGGLGNPDLDGYGYGDAVFEKLILPHSSAFDLCIVVTSVPIQGNFFTRTVGDKLIITTFHQADELLQESGRSSEAYVAMTVCAEIVSIEFQRVTQRPWADLFHFDPRGCLFDFAGVKSQMVAKLRSSSICDDTLGTLDRANLNKEVLSFACSLLTRIRRPSISQAFMLAVSTPWLSFAYGGVVVGAAVNLVSSVVMNREPMDVLQRNIAIGSIVAVALLPLSVYAWLYYREFKQRAGGSSRARTS